MPKDHKRLDMDSELSLDEILNDAHGLDSGAEDISLEDILAEFGTNKPRVSKVEPVVSSDAWEHFGDDKDLHIAEVKLSPKKEEPVTAPKKAAPAPAPEAMKPQIKIQKASSGNMEEWDESFFTPIYATKPIAEPTAPKRPEKPKQPETPLEATKQPEPPKIEKQMPRSRMEDTLNMKEWFESEEDFEEEKEPDYVPETPGEYVKRNAMHVRKMGIRAVIAFLLCLPICYVSFAEQCKLPIPSIISHASQPLLYLFILTAAQVVFMLLHMDIIGHGIKKLVTLHADMLSVVMLSTVASLTHAVYMILNEGARSVAPFCAVSCVTLFFTGYGLYLRESARLRACRAASVSKSPNGVFLSERDDMVNILKHPVENSEFFTKYIQIIDGAERYWKYFAPIVIVASIVFAGISSYGAGEPARFFWAFAGITSVSAPFFVMLCYPLPFSKITKKLFGIGAAIAGWYAAFSLSGERNVIIHDNDLFPKGSITLHGIKVFNNHSLEKSVSYATSMLKEAHCGLYSVFGELLRSQYGKCEHVYHLMHHESGGMEADICGDHILFGTASFMLRMGVRVSETTNMKNALYLAVNAQFAAVFNLNYKVSEDVRMSLIAILRRRVIPVMAVVDCNQTPAMVETELKLRPGSLEYPSIEERLDLSSDNQILEYDPCALIMRSGMTPFASAILGARKLRKSTIRNVFLSTACAVIGMLLMFYITFVGSYASGSPYNVFLYLLLWTVPVYLLSMRSSI